MNVIIGFSLGLLGELLYVGLLLMADRDPGI